VGDAYAVLLWVGPLVEFAVIARPDWSGLQNRTSSPHIRLYHLDHGLGERLSIVFGLIGEVKAQDMLSCQEDETQQRDQGLHPD
jgi:hypothetical protein